MIVELLLSKRTLLTHKQVFPSWNSSEKYSTQLEVALNEYTNLKVRGADFDAAELYAQRMTLRADIMAAVVDHIQATYGENMDSVMMFNSKRDVAR